MAHKVKGIQDHSYHDIPVVFDGAVIHKGHGYTCTGLVLLIGWFQVA